MPAATARKAAERTRAHRDVLLGHPTPRIAPPVPARSDLPAFRVTADAMGLKLMAWQETAARYLTATKPDGTLRYREVCIVVARQQGKTTLMKPYIIRALRAGKHVMHIAQNRELPRHMFGMIADALSEEPDLFPKRRGRTIWPRYGSGQEEIVLVNGGSYRIAASTRGGGRGWPNDLLIFDELREMTDFDVIGAAEPTLTMSPDPQTVYLSNAGTEQSVVLNSVRDRAGKDESLAYLEWSASPDRSPDDVKGWAEANPAFGHFPSVQKTLDAAYRRHSLAGTIGIFETEHLCRSVPTLQPRLVAPTDFERCRAEVEKPVRPILAFKMNAARTRAAAVIAWQQKDGTVACRVFADVTGEPIDSDAFGRDLRDAAVRAGVWKVRYSAVSDASIARWFKDAKPMDGREYANASGKFVELVQGNRLRWDGSNAIADDLAFVSRKPYEESGTYTAVGSSDEHSPEAALAAIRAVYEASQERLERPRIF